MHLLNLPETGGDTLATLAFNRKVLMVGATSFKHVANLAQIARIVVLVPDTGSGEYEVERPHAAELARKLDETGQSGHVIFHRVPFEQLQDAFRPKQFDLAVIDPAAAGLPNVEGPVALADSLADTVVVIDTGQEGLYEAVCALLASRPGAVMVDGSLIIARAAIRLENGAY